MPLTATLIIISFSSPTVSFIPDLKPFSANPYDCSFFSFTVRLFLLFLVFFVLQYLVVGSVR